MSGDLESKVYEMQMLKQQYGLSSSNAHAFMRSKAAYEQLRTTVNHALKSENIALNLSWQEISNLCENTRFVISDALNEPHFQHTGGFSYFGVREFNDGLLNDRLVPAARDNPGTPGLVRRDVHDREKVFEFDYAAFLQAFARAQKQGHDKSEAFRQAFLIFKDDTESYLTSPRGKRLNYAKFVETVMDYGQDRPTEEITSDAEMIAQDESIRIFSQEKIEEFQEWQMTGSRAYSHGNILLNKIAPEERKFLYGLSNKDDPYDRAVQEKTLGRMETERNLALHYILGNYELEDKVTASIVKAVADLTQQRDRRKERHKSLIETKAPSVVIEIERVRVEKTQYTLNAVRKNRRWLEEILSR